MAPRWDPDALDFPAQWRSTTGVVAVLLLLIEAALVLVALTTPRSHAWAWWAAAFAGAALAWPVGAQLLTKWPVLRVAPRGVGGWFLRGHTVPWREIEDVSVQSVQGNVQVVLKLLPDAGSLAPTRRLLTGRGRERRIALGALPKKEHARAIHVLQAAFAAYARGHAQAAQQSRLDEARFTVEFETRLRQLTPRTWALYAVVALNVAVWVWNVASGVPAVRPLASDLFRWGANSAWAVTRDGEWWRLLTATFLHGGVVHLALNMLGLWQGGKLLNRLHGNLQFLVVYFAAALGGAALSLHFSAQNAVSVGASGAVFGVIGALLVSVYRHRERMPVLLGKDVLTSQAVFAAYALLQGFAREGIDNAAHSGGLVAGAVAAWLLVEKIESEPRARSRVARRAITVATLSAAIVLVVLATPAPKVDHARVFAMEAVMRGVAPRLQAAQQELARDLRAGQEGRIAEAALADAMEKKHLPAMRAVWADIAPLALPASDPRQANLADLQALTRDTIALMEWQVKKSRGAVEPQAADAAMAPLAAAIKQASARLQQRAQAAAAAKQP